LRVHRNRLALVCVALLLSAVLVRADEWRLSLGVAWRSFGDVQFEPFALRNWNPVPSPAPFGFQQFDNAVLGGYNVVAGQTLDADTAAFTGAAADLDPAGHWTPVLGLERRLWRRGRLELGLVADMQYAHLSAAGSATGDAADPGAFDAWYYRYQIYDPGSGLRIDPQPPLGGWPQGPFPGFSNLTSAVVKQRFELDALSLDFGATAAMWTGRVRWQVRGGVSANGFQTESSRVESARWRKPGSTEYESYRIEDDDRTETVRFGHFAALGVDGALTPSWSVGAMLRYDWVNGTAATDHASLDPDGHSFLLNVTYSF